MSNHIHTPHRHDHGKHPGTASATPAQPPTPDVIYTCPMHPQIRRNAPGTCPICGMALGTGEAVR